MKNLTRRLKSRLKACRRPSPCGDGILEIPCRPRKGTVGQRPGAATLVAGAVATLLCLSALPAQAQADAEQNKPDFSDVPRGHWAYNAVQRLAQAGIIEGYPLNTEQRIPATVANSKEDSAATLVKVGLAAHVALKGSYIDVVATPASVTLSGTVRNQAQKNLAENIAKQQAPDRMIINRLRVVGPAKR